MPSFIVSELRTAFQMGFVLYIPFLVIDMVVSSVLISMAEAQLADMDLGEREVLLGEKIIARARTIMKRGTPVPSST